MTEIKRRNITVPLRNQTDVLVIGAGPAGFGAAVSAARNGAKVTLVEREFMAGGMWTLGLLSPLFETRNHDGLNRELRETLQARGAWGGLWDCSFDPTEMTLLLDEYFDKLEIDILYGAHATETILHDGVVMGVIVETKSGPMAILAKTVIDCTGDGDTAASAGAGFDLGRPSDGFWQPMTMMFKIGGLNPDYPRDSVVEWYQALTQKLGEEELTRQIPFNYPALIRLPGPGEALLQWTHIAKRNPLDANDLSEAVREGRRQIRRAMKLFPLIRDILGDVRLLQLPQVIGVRESRRIHGDYTISDTDVTNRATFPDNICHVLFGVDIHEPCEKKQTVITHSGFYIPARSLLPRNLENLLVAGRCISGSYVAHAAYRVTGNCLKMGEEAGRIAAEAVTSGRSPREMIQHQYFSDHFPTEAKGQ